MTADKGGSDPHLLARVLEDARRGEERFGRSFAETREEVLLRNKELVSHYSELSDGRHLVAYFARVEHPGAAMQPSDVALRLAGGDQVSGFDQAATRAGHGLIYVDATT